MRLLLVEDDPLLGDGIESGLKQSGFTVDWAKDGHAAQLALDTTEYELVVLDIGLPRVSGLELLQRLRKKGSDLPVLLLTARDTVRDRVTGLDAGADDYLVKPFDLSELVARIRALLRRAHGRSASVIRYADMELSPDTLCVTRNGEQIALSARECAILTDLLEHRGTALSRARLEESLYGWNEEVESNAVEVHIHNLRKKLGNELIKTIRGVGYLIRKDSP
ncbi:MAG TPA: response regulator [Noviherbaspirillum sp.]|uniref:response regulator n=1 Tax=Noviherbaspirillum sp. TaxID=1926288 RepID=UPI002B465879|nr:response regulator [Noviherbaspirillum sp.]HJV87596.1 response regulator [Noviherbaspirillum sp.]